MSRGCGNGVGRAKQNRLRNALGFQPHRGGDDACVLALRQNDFAIAPPCDIKQPIEQFHASHRVRNSRMIPEKWIPVFG